MKTLLCLLFTVGLSACGGGDEAPAANAQPAATTQSDLVPTTVVTGH